MNTGVGVDHVYVSSDANVTAGAPLPDHLTGILANVLGTLVIDEGIGTGQSLMISDEGNKNARTYTLNANGVTGLAPASITYGASAGRPRRRHHDLERLRRRPRHRERRRTRQPA